jgi:hypothetical protein
MTLAELGALGEFLGFFAVLVTLMYLAVQTKEAREVTTSQAARNVVVDFRVIWSSLGEDVDKAHLIRLAVNDWDSISKDEQMIAHVFFVNLITHYSSALEQEGKLPELKSFVLGWEDNLMGLLQCTGGRKWYDTCNYLFLPIVRERVNERFSNPDDLPPAWTESIPWWGVDKTELSAQST